MYNPKNEQDILKIKAGAVDSLFAATSVKSTGHIDLTTARSR
jgi:hypothetical protein